MLNFLYCFSVLCFGAWLGLGIRWGFWLWDSLAEMLSDFRKWREKRCKRKIDDPG